MTNELNGRICIVTGATSGIGEVTARELARMGATTVLIARNEDKARRVTAEIKLATENPNVDYLIADLSSLEAIRKVAAEFRAKYDQLHVLVNNAGVFLNSYQKTIDGYEKTFATNHLSYFLLTDLLLDMLKASGTADRKARIVNVSSDAHQMASINFDNLQGEKGYSGFQAYGRSKLANILFTYELARRLEAENAPVTANVLHPGFVATGFGRNNGALVRLAMQAIQAFALNAEQGAETSIYLAASPKVEGITGQYFEKKMTKQSNKNSYNEADQKRLWEISEALINVKETTV